jgi:hypothetical protein
MASQRMQYNTIQYHGSLSGVRRHLLGGNETDRHTSGLFFIFIKMVRKKRPSFAVGPAPATGFELVGIRISCDMVWKGPWSSSEVKERDGRLDR